MPSYYCQWCSVPVWRPWREITSRHSPSQNCCSDSTAQQILSSWLAIIHGDVGYAGSFRAPRCRQAIGIAIIGLSRSVCVMLGTYAQVARMSWEAVSRLVLCRQKSARVKVKKSKSVWHPDANLISIRQVRSRCEGNRRFPASKLPLSFDQYTETSTAETHNTLPSLPTCVSVPATSHLTVREVTSVRFGSLSCASLLGAWAWEFSGSPPPLYIHLRI